MPDYNWFGDEAVQVATQGLREEATKWHGLADRMSAVASAASAQGLQPAAFSVIVDGPVGFATTSDLNGAYQKMYEWLNSLFQEGAVQFDAMGTALTANADWYDDADENSVQNFDRIASS